MNINEKKLNLFNIDDLYIACVLKASGIQLQQITRNNNGKATFVFNNPNQIAETTIQNHWDKKLKVISLDLVEAINQLKTRIHSGI